MNPTEHIFILGESVILRRAWVEIPFGMSFAIIECQESLWWAYGKYQAGISGIPGAVVEFLNAPTSLACHYQSRTCKMDSYQFLYSIPIFLMSQCGELCIEHGFHNPADKYWYAHPVASQNLPELYGSDSRRKTTLLRPELCSSTPSYIKYNLYLSSNKTRGNPCFLRLGTIWSFLFQYYVPKKACFD